MNRHKTMNPVQTGVNGALLTASANSNLVPCNSARRVDFLVKLTWAAASNVSANLVIYYDGDSTTEVRPQASYTVSGVSTIKNRSVIHPVTASENFAFEIEVENGWSHIQLQNITGTGASTDTVIMEARTIYEN